MSRRWFFIAAILILVLAGTILADVTIKSTIENASMGGMMNMQGTQQVLISGDKSKTVSNMKMTNKVVKFLGGGKPAESAEITRVDKELIWHLDTKDKSYTEVTFAQMKAMMEAGMAKAKENQKNADSSRASAEITVTPTGKTQSIAGYTANEVLIKTVFEGKDSASGKSGKMILEADMWMAKDVPGHAEYLAFHKSMAEKMGLTDASQADMSKQLAAFGVDANGMYDKMKDVEGMPLLTIVSISSEGLDTLMAKANDSMEAAQKRQAEEQAAKDSSAEKSDQPAVQSVDDMKKTAAKALGGLFGKKKDKKKEADEKAAQPKTNEKPYLFHVTTTVTEISQGSISGSEFEIPDGYKLKKE
jgi:hypothetical protein